MAIADGDAVAVDHQIGAGALVGTVIGVRKSEIEGKVIGAIGIERAPTYLIERPLPEIPKVAEV